MVKVYLNERGFELYPVLFSCNADWIYQIHTLIAMSCYASMRRLWATWIQGGVPDGFCYLCGQRQPVPDKNGRLIET